MSRYRLLAPVRPLLHPPSSQRHLLPIIASTNALPLSTRWNRFSTSAPTRSTNFDTLKVAQRLEANGFTPEQSKGVMQLLKDVIDESIIGLNRTMVTREEQDKVRQTNKQPPPTARFGVLTVDDVSTKSRLCTTEK